MNLAKKYEKMPAILKRTAWAKSIGFGISLLAFIVLCLTGVFAVHPLFCFGILFWYSVTWAFIGLAGIMDEHPILWKMWTARGIMIGAMMNLVFFLLSAETLLSVSSLIGISASTGVLFSLALIEGAIVWWIIDLIVTNKFWEGKKLMKK